MAWNEENSIGPMLASLLGQSVFARLAARGEGSEIVCLANGCTDRTVAIAQGAFDRMQRENPVPGLRVLLVSCGAEETLQDGIRAFMRTHREELAPGRTWFVNLDTVGSPHLVLLEAEGPVRMERYVGPWLRELLAECAEELGVALQRGFRARASTDSVIPSRAGYPTATLVSMTDWRAPANYHLRSDVPENLDYRTVAAATRLVRAVCEALSTLSASAQRPSPQPA